MKRKIALQTVNNILLYSLTFLFISEFRNILSTESKSFIKYNVPSDESRGPFSGKEAVEKFQREFIIKTMYFSTNDKMNDVILNEFAELLHKESLKKTSITVYRIYIPQASTYGRFISLLNLMKKGNYKRYLEWENYFYVLTNNNRSKI